MDTRQKNMEHGIQLDKIVVDGHYQLEEGRNYAVIVTVIDKELGENSEEKKEQTRFASIELYR